MYIIFEALLFTNLFFILIICCLCSTLSYVIYQRKKNETKDEYTQVNLHIQLLIVHPNNDIDIANEFLI